MRKVDKVNLLYQTTLGSWVITTAFAILTRKIGPVCISCALVVITYLWGRKLMTNEEGNRKIRELLFQRDNSVFNDWEKGLILDLQKKRYEDLTKREKVIVNRLSSWLGSFKE